MKISPHFYTPSHVPFVSKTRLLESQTRRGLLGEGKIWSHLSEASSIAMTADTMTAATLPVASSTWISPSVQTLTAKHIGWMRGSVGMWVFWKRSQSVQGGPPFADRFTWTETGTL